MKRNFFVGLTIVSIVVMVSCIDPYIPATSTKGSGILVVNGFLNSVGDTSFITLTTSSNLSDTSTQPRAETGAFLAIRSANGDNFPLKEKGNGVYFLPYYAGDPSQAAALYIRRVTGEEYLSSYVEIKNTPPIDSVFFVKQDAGLNIYVNAHDAQNATHFYRWTFEETWEYVSKFQSALIRHGDSIINRSRDEDIHSCWKTANSGLILITSTTALSSDRVDLFLLNYFPYDNVKISIKYSILVHQYAMTVDEYQYWLNIQKNTENVGTVFGPLPSVITGNIKCTSNPSLPVLGYFSSTSPQTVRFTIDALADKLPTVNHYQDGYDACIGQDLFVPINDALGATTFLYLNPVYSGPALIGYDLGPAQCTDCRYKGGSTVKPPFF